MWVFNFAKLQRGWIFFLPQVLKLLNLLVEYIVISWTGVFRNHDDRKNNLIVLWLLSWKLQLP